MLNGKIERVLGNSALFLITALIAGFLLPGYSIVTKDFVEIALILSMIFSTTEIQLGDLGLKKKYKKVILSVLINYVFLTSIIILFTSIFITDADFRTGFFLIAVLPPAIAVIPFTSILKGDVHLSAVSNTLMYFFSLFLTPFLLTILIGTNEVRAYDLLWTLMELILLPLAISRILRRIKAYEKIQKNKNIVINLMLFIIVYSVVGINRDVFFNIFILSALITVAFIRTFVTGLSVHLVARLMKVEKGTRTSYTLFGSLKNLGIAATISLKLFGVRASIPSAICMPFEIIFVLLLIHFNNRYKSGEQS
jgi:BASS family bile acid:Na+ symporter